MKFNEYQKLALRTANVDLPENLAICNFVIGLSGETGEVADYLKKVIFHAHALDKNKLESELGDVLWYISNLANVFGLELEDVAKTNIEKLRKRYPNGFNSEDSKNRKE